MTNRPSDPQEVRPQAGRALIRARRWLSERDWWSWDLAAGLVVGGWVATLSYLYPAMRTDSATTYLYAVFGGLLAVLGIVMAVLAILVGLMGPSYRALLDALPGGTRRAMNPYFIVCWGAALGALAAVLSALAWAAMAPTIKVTVLAGISAIAAWVLTGCAQLLRVTFNHATDSAEMDRQIANVRAAREQRLRELRGQ